MAFYIDFLVKQKRTLLYTHLFVFIAFNLRFVVLLLNLEELCAGLKSRFFYIFHFFAFEIDIKMLRSLNLLSRYFSPKYHVEVLVWIETSKITPIRVKCAFLITQLLSLVESYKKRAIKPSLLRLSLINSEQLLQTYSSHDSINVFELYPRMSSFLSLVRKSKGLNLMRKK